MYRLTKAAIATGGAAVLLLGGAGTMAFWTASGTLSSAAITSGELTPATQNVTCTSWTYQNGGAAVNLIVPGDVVQATCTMTVTGSGDHLSVLATESPSPATFQQSNALTGALQVAVGDVSVDGGAPVAAGTPISLSATTATSHTLAIALTVTFPYGTAADNTTNQSGGFQAQLSNIALTLTQQQP
jgi:alternate signal-mediated exported protein